jgi:glycosyltransferase involved in cell wall biosynthesis
VLAGDYESDGFKSSYQELKREIADANLDGDVVFTGYVPEERLSSLFGGASLFAFPSLWEGFGLPVVEAMACGLPVVAGRGHALDELVENAGILVDPRNPQEIAGAMERVLADPKLAATLRESALRRASEFSWDRAAADLLEIFRELASKRNP